jgi:hypothetical protein
MTRIAAVGAGRMGQGIALACAYCGHAVSLVDLKPRSVEEISQLERLLDVLKSIGKVPVVCASSPGYIVPRIQALAMNEAARMVEEGIASGDGCRPRATRPGALHVHPHCAPICRRRRCVGTRLNWSDRLNEWSSHIAIRW